MAVRVHLLLILSALLAVSGKKELKLLHVLAINKFYVPDYDYSSTKFRFPENLTYEYFTNKAVDLPNSVKLNLFDLGAGLRVSYDGFLGSVYTDDAMRMRTTEFPASIIAGELINAGLWPPMGPQIWKEDLAWQPIPFEYEPAEKDTLLLGSLCPSFKAKTEAKLESEHSKLLERLNATGEVKVSSLRQVPLLLLALENGIELNQTLPDWTRSMLKSGDLLNASLAAYDSLSFTRTQRRLNGGSLLKTILDDCRDYAEGLARIHERKINVYSGDDRTFAGVLRILGIPQYELPASGAALVFELYAEKNEYFLKIVYRTGTKDESLPYELPGCELFCPKDKFADLVADALPEDSIALCYADDSNVAAGAPFRVSLSANVFLSALLMYFVSSKQIN